MVKFKYRGPNTDQPAVSVDCKPMKSKDKAEIFREGTNTRTPNTVAGISDKWLSKPRKSYGSLYNPEES